MDSNLIQLYELTTMSTLQEWAKAAAEYLVTLQKWIDENKHHLDPLVQDAMTQQAANIAPYLE
jgi:transcription termination factor NusB